VTTKKGELILFNCVSLKTNQGEIVVIQKTESFDHLCDNLLYVGNDQRSLSLFKNNNVIRKIQNLGMKDNSELFNLMKRIEKKMPFLGGINPKIIYKTQRVKYVNDETIHSFDYRILIQFLNMNTYLQATILHDLGISKRSIFEKISEFMNEHG